MGTRWSPARFPIIDEVPWFVVGTYCTTVLYRWIAPSKNVTIHVPRKFGGMSVFHLRRQSNTA